MRNFVNLILLVLISVTAKIVMTNGRSTKTGNGEDEALEQLLLEVKSNFDELRSDMQSLEDTANNEMEMIRNLIKDQQAQREMFSNMKRMDRQITTSGRRRLVSSK